MTYTATGPVYILFHTRVAIGERWVKLVAESKEAAMVEATAYIDGILTFPVTKWTVGLVTEMYAPETGA